jgi:thiol:disulfide interchange protein DsbD
MNPAAFLFRGPVIASAVLMVFASAAGAQSPAKSKNSTTADRIDFKVEVRAEDPFSPANQAGLAKPEYRRGDVVKLIITGIPRPGFHTYPITQHTEIQKPDGLSKLTYAPTPGLVPLAFLTESEPDKVNEEGLGVFLEYSKPFTWSQDILILPDTAPGPKQLHFEIKLQVCDKSCVTGVHKFSETIMVSDQPAIPLSPELEKRKAEKIPPGQGNVEIPSADAGTVAQEHRAELEGVLKDLEGNNATRGSTSLLGFILAGIFWGGVSLITPCVFPMIPITVSFFLKQSEKQHHKPVTMALVYCGTIVVVLTIAAVALLSFFRFLSVHPLMNFGLGALFVFFALSLFGMYDIELPSGLARFTSQREGQGGLVGTMFMALTFTIVSFACVAPFLGGFGGTAADSSISWLHRILGGLAFAATFASPFFVLALFPNLLKKMPKSGSWLNSVKVVMGFLELAAALKFFRAGELVLLPKPTFFTYDLVLGLWIAISLLCGLYLLNVYRLPHDSPLESIGVPRMLFGLAFIGLGFYLLPAQFKVDADGKPQRPNGTVYAWIDSFLLPEPSHGKGDLAWSGNLKKAIDEARAETKKTGKRSLVFVDFTGETCTNCKINENNVFTKPDIRDLFKRYKLVQLYTDKVPDEFYSPEAQAKFNGGVTRQKADAAANLWFQKAAFDTEQLPLYVILEPRADGKIDVLGQYDEGKIMNDAAFAQFLKTPLDGGATRTAQVTSR